MCWSWLRYLLARSGEAEMLRMYWFLGLFMLFLSYQAPSGLLSAGSCRLIGVVDGDEVTWLDDMADEVMLFDDIVA